MAMDQQTVSELILDQLIRIADAIELANKLAIAEYEFRNVIDKEKHDEWLRKHGLGDLIK